MDFGRVGYKATSDQTGGAFSLFEVVVRPQSGAPAHIQHEGDECIYVLEGEFEFVNDGETLKADVGSLIYAPRGNLHTYKNAGTTPGRLLISQTLGGLIEQFFEEVGEEAVDKSSPPTMEDPPDLGRIVAIAARYGIEIPPPPA